MCNVWTVCSPPALPCVLPTGGGWLLSQTGRRVRTSDGDGGRGNVPMQTGRRGNTQDAAFRGLTDHTAIDGLFDSLLRFIRSFQQWMQMLN